MLASPGRSDRGARALRAGAADCNRGPTDSRCCWPLPSGCADRAASRRRAGRCRAAVRRRQCGDDPLRDARRGDGRRRVDAHPALAGEPDFGPGVGIGLAHDEVAIDRVELAALIAGDHPRRNAGGAHQEDEGRRVVLAEAAARLEEEFVDRVRAEQRRQQGVVEVLVAKEGAARPRRFAPAAGASTRSASARVRGLIRPAVSGPAAGWPVLRRGWRGSRATRRRHNANGRAPVRGRRASSVGASELSGGRRVATSSASSQRWLCASRRVV
jgi:hypothetical protein